MKATIVFAHPGNQSFNHDILQQVKSTFENMGVEYNLRDLYKMNFNPVFGAEDMNKVENNQITSDIEEEQELVSDADLLVMVYPIWWWSQPAILKGYIDRVFTHKFAFVYEDNGPVGMLTNKQAVVFTTTRESEQEMKQVGYDQVISKQIVDGVLRFSGFDNVIHKNFAAVPYVSEEERKNYLADVERTIMSIRIPERA